MPPFLPYLAIFFSCILYAWLGYGLARPDTGPLFLAYASLFALYGLVVQSKMPDRWAWRAGWTFRIILLGAVPWLSEDYVRFIWDGRLLINGVNPYLVLPVEAVRDVRLSEAGLTPELFQKLNSPHYYSVYPPVSQALYGLTAWLSGKNEWMNIILLHIGILLAEAGTFRLLPRILNRLGQSAHRGLYYWLNPLVILELTGNLHGEAIMIYFCLLALWWLLNDRLVGSAAALALAVATKLLPLIFLPLLIHRMGWKRGGIYTATTALFTLATILPFISTDLFQHFFSSVNLYFQKFEFNASVYYLMRQVGYWVKGYNIIASAGLWLSAIALIGIVLISVRVRSVPAALVLVLTYYFALATTVHPWYLTTVVAAALFSRFRYPIVWSAVAFLSYATYRQLPYDENLWLTAAEYLLVFALLFYELRINAQKEKGQPLRAE